MANKEFHTDISLVGSRLTGVPAPVASEDAANKSYVDSSILSWNYLVSNWTTTPSMVGSSTVSGQQGQVFAYTLGSTTRYRFVPNTYSASLDAFYSSYINEVLSGVITKRG
jgi:hypothetical protein